ncbi:MAG: ATP-binding cassette domain-containing protein [Cytophagales bacterium]|nr:ATP-binding cassette domain-containing protein [Cytophagales bacterium]
MIEIQHLHFSYANTAVINDVHINLHMGYTHGLVGLNGSGKTTLLKLIYGLLKPDSGNIYVNGSKIKKNDVSLLETQNYFYSYITAKEYLDLIKKSPDTDEWASLLNIPLHEFVDTFSTGMKKKLALLGIILQKKPIWILDEPYNGLDTESVKAVEHIIKQFNAKGKTIIITSHIIDTLIGICQYIHWLNAGTIKKSYSQDLYKTMNEEMFQTLEATLHDKISKLI